MEFDGLSLFVSFVISGVGFVLFSFGKKMERFPQLVGGLVLMIFPYFVSTIWLQIVITLVILGAIVFLLNQGV